MMNENAAKEKWCPLVRELSDGGGAAMNANGAWQARCIASACMSWRWSRAKETKAFLAAVRQYMKDASCDFNHATQKVYARDGGTYEQSEGYCGAFGKPES